MVKRGETLTPTLFNTSLTARTAFATISSSSHPAHNVKVKVSGGGESEEMMEKIEVIR